MHAIRFDDVHITARGHNVLGRSGRTRRHSVVERAGIRRLARVQSRGQEVTTNRMEDFS
jgi:hypothetical protein